MLDKTASSDGTQAAPARAGPLAGVRLIDLTSVALGPYATQILGDLGADVIKVEQAPSEDQAGGDIMRWGGQAPSGPEAGLGPLFMNLNRNKRSVSLDLSNAAGREALHRLVAGADVFASNIRMESLTRNGAGFDALNAVRPGLVYVHACGFASNGPYAGMGAYDDLIQAASGAADLLPRAYDDGVPRYLPMLAADKTVGLFMVYATIAALFQRERTGEGQFVEVPMMECFTHYVMTEGLYGNVFDPPSGPAGYARVLNPERRPFRTADGWIAVLPYTDAQWLAFFTLAGRREEYLADERFNTYPARMRNIRELYASLEAIMLERGTEDWLAALIEAKIPCMRLHGLDSILTDPHLQATGFFDRQTHTSEGTVVAMKHPVHFSQGETATRHLPAKLGEHTAEVLREAGLSDEEVDGMRAAGAFGAHAKA